MGWTSWILASAVLLAFYDLAKKASVRANAVLPVLLCSTLSGCAAFAAGLWASGRIDVVGAADARTVAIGLAKAVIVGTSWIFTFCGLRTLPITVATPIRASSPALVFVLAFFLYGELPSALQGVGMAAVFAGYWTFSWAGRHEGIDFLRNRAVWCACAGAVCSAFSSIFDKYAFQLSHRPLEAVQFYFQAGLVLVYLVVFAAQRLLGLRHDRFEWRWTVPLVGILLAATDWLYFRGIADPAASISIAALLRRFSVAITFVVGAFVFRERNLLRKLLALSLILAGIAVLCLARQSE